MCGRNLSPPKPNRKGVVMRPPFPPHNQPSADSPATAATTATAQPTAITPEQQQQMMVHMYQMLYSQAQAFGLAMPPLDFSPAGMMQLMQISMQLQMLSAQLAGQGTPNPQATPQFSPQVQANHRQWCSRIRIHKDKYSHRHRHRYLLCLLCLMWPQCHHRP